MILTILRRTYTQEGHFFQICYSFLIKNDGKLKWCQKYAKKNSNSIYCEKFAIIFFCIRLLSNVRRNKMAYVSVYMVYVADRIVLNTNKTKWIFGAEKKVVAKKKWVHDSLFLPKWKLTFKTFQMKMGIQLESAFSMFCICPLSCALNYWKTNMWNNVKLEFDWGLT